MCTRLPYTMCKTAKRTQVCTCIQEYLQKKNSKGRLSLAKYAGVPAKNSKARLSLAKGKSKMAAKTPKPISRRNIQDGAATMCTECHYILYLYLSE